MALPPTPALVVFGLAAVALALFASEAVPPDVAAIGVLVALYVLRPWTGVDADTALVGFANPATVTIVAMYVLSEAVRQTGVIEHVGDAIEAFAHGSDSRLLGAVVGTTSLSAGVVNNVPVVAVFVPMVTDLASRARRSPSAFLLPLSYAAMLGGTLTLLGSSTNLVVSALAADALGRQIGVFEMTPVGVLVLVTGVVYLLTVGRRLVPERVSPSATLAETYGVSARLARLEVREGSPFAGQRLDDVRATVSDAAVDVAVLQLSRDGERYLATRTDETVGPGDTLTVRGNLQAVNEFATEYDLRQLPRQTVSTRDLHLREGRGNLVEVVLPEGSRFVGDTVREANLAGYHNAVVLALKRGDDVRSDGIADHRLAVGDTLLLQVRERNLAELVENLDVVVTRGVGPSQSPETEPEPVFDRETTLVLGTVASVVGLAAVGVLPVVIAALAGVVVVTATDVISPTDAYGAVSWNVVFLLAGIYPLGVAARDTGGAAWVAEQLAATSSVLPIIAVLAVTYLVTAALANLVGNAASAILMTPVAVDTAASVGAETLSFVLAVLFAASTAFLTPTGYATNLMVYGPGGYEFGDYARVGLPLQLLLTVVTTAGIWVVYGV
ncbi:SLC13 family permease [Halobacterium litoreum]|uniref:SLC13 family permease n=1 Tax=Halobacterium litoreum TaxID=2039234 RepID=A0ABD5NGB0_9EURY|nr:SLC13 family permease [Halobacterium litoreum]UHH12859.1 SLC13 family permease [Halobacterium litoreum]